MCSFLDANYVVARKALEEMLVHCSTPVDLSGQLALIWVDFKPVDDKHGYMMYIHERLVSRTKHGLNTVKKNPISKTLYPNRSLTQITNNM